MGWGRFAASLLALGASATGSWAMSAPGLERYCHVVAGEKLPVAAGGSQALCTAVERAIAAQAPHARYTVEVRVVSASMLSTALVVNGKALPEQKFAVMDRDLNEGSIERFAHSIAAAVAKAAQP